MRTFSALIVSLLGVAPMAAATACNGTGDKTASGRVSDGVVATATAAEMRDGERVGGTSSGDSSPFIVGEWKFKTIGGETPTVDTEFRFINPTNETVTLEYAFFELDGTFCGCDRDDFPPNKTTVYTVEGEALSVAPNPKSPFPNLFNCKGTSGALKSIVFKHKGQRIFLDDATQVGFQTHAFGNIVEEPPDASPNFNFLTGNVMTESDMTSVALSDSTREEIRAIHEQCLVINGPL